MTAKQSWVEPMRAESLAIIVLTRHQALEVIPIAPYAPTSGYDLLVRVDGADMAPKPEFGIALKGTRRPLDGLRGLTATPNATREVPGSGIPVCLFLYNVVTEEGIYRWLNEPVIERDDRVSLRLAADPQRDERGRGNGLANGAPFQKIDNDAVRRIVDRVVAWYAAKERIVQRAMTAV